MLAGGITWSGIVMIAPPNQGSIVAHRMSGLPGIGKLFQYADYTSTNAKASADLSCCTAVITALRHIPWCFAPVSLLALCASARLLYGRAGIELGAEIAKGDPWPNPPQPCGIIAGTKSLALANPTSWLTFLFHMISGEQRRHCQMHPCRIIAGCVLQ